MEKHANQIAIAAIVVAVLAMLAAPAARLGAEVKSLQLSDILHSLDGKCHHPAMHTYIVSSFPLIIYFENFFTARERKKLLELAQPLYNRSLVGMENSSTLWAGRTSSTAFFQATSVVEKCITERASRIQGFVPSQNIELLQATRYFSGQQYINHWDWSLGGEDDEVVFIDRISTFFGVLTANCTDCGTRFPLLRRQTNGIKSQWCNFIDCDAEELVFRAKEGNALFWTNVDENGDGDARMLHAGLPPADGYKVGLNIWTGSAARR